MHIHASFDQHRHVEKKVRRMVAYTILSIETHMGKTWRITGTDVKDNQIVIDILSDAFESLPQVGHQFQVLTGSRVEQTWQYGARAVRVGTEDGKAVFSMGGLMAKVPQALDSGDNDMYIGFNLM